MRHAWRVLCLKIPGRGDCATHVPARQPNFSFQASTTSTRGASATLSVLQVQREMISSALRFGRIQSHVSSVSAAYGKATLRMVLSVMTLLEESPRRGWAFAMPKPLRAVRVRHSAMWSACKELCVLPQGSTMHKVASRTEEAGNRICWRLRRLYKRGTCRLHNNRVAV